jgi:hypothetical protein
MALLYLWVMNPKIQQHTFQKDLAGVWLSLVLLAAALDIANGIQIASQPAATISAVGGGDSSVPIVSPDGRYVLFASTANNLVAGSGGQTMPDYVLAKENVFLRDRQAGTTILVSLNVAGTGGGNGDSWPSAISTNGQFALFDSTAPDLVPGDTNGAKDIFLRDVIHGTTMLVSISTNGFSGNGESREATMTPDGRYVAFVSAANNLVAGDSNGIPDIFVRDMQAGTTILASPGATAVPQTQATPFTLGSSSEWPILSVDGRYVAFYSTATNLVSGHTLGEVYVRDLIGGVTIWASSNAHNVIASPASANYAMSTNGQFIAYESSGGTPGGVVFLYNLTTSATVTIFTNGPVPASLDLDARNIDISANGSFVAFTATNGPAVDSSTSVELWNALSNTTSLVSGGTVGAQSDFPRLDQSGRYVAFFDNEASLTTNSDGKFHVYLRDTVAGTVQLVDVGTNGTAPISSLTTPFHFNADGDVLAFECPDGAMSSNPNKLDVFARDLASNTTEVISVPAPALASSTAFGSSGLSTSSISSNGQYVAFYSDAAGLATNAAWGVRNIFVHDFAGGSNVLASVATNGLVAGNSGSFEPAISGDGRYLAFSSYASNLVANDTNNAEDVFVRDLQAGSTMLVSVGAGGAGEGNGNSYSPQISTNGRYVLFFSAANNIVAGAANEFFWRDLQAGTTYAINATNTAAMTPDGSNVVFPAGSQLHLWQAQNQSNTTIVSISATILDVAVSPDGTRAAFGTASAIYTANLAQHTSAQLGLASRPTSQARFQFSGNSLFLANLVAPASESNQVYLYNFQTAINTPVSQSYASGAGGNGNCDSLAISASGRYVAYRSFATNLVPDDTNAVPDVFLYDGLTGGTTLVSVSQLGNRAANGRSLNPVFSGDGQTLFFQSWASDLGADDFNQASDIFALALSTNGVGGVTNAAPPLEFSGISLGSANGQFTTNQGPTLTWETVPGTGYQVQFKNNLTDSQWQDLDGRATVVGSQGEITDLAPGPTQRFYRIISY